MTKAVILRTLGTVEQIDLPDEDGGYAVIRDAVGGYIDAVRADDFIGYVHDEGLLIGLAPNVMATFLFARPIVGDVVIVGCLNERGEYDGENYDVPTEIVEMATEKALAMNTHEEFRQRVVAGRDRIMGDPIKVYAQNESGEWERV